MIAIRIRARSPWAALLATSLALVGLAFSISDSPAQSAGNFEIRRSTIDGGGGRSAGGAFEATGTIGQPDASISVGGAFEMRGGFWAGPAPVDASDALFSNGFEPTAAVP